MKTFIVKYKDNYCKFGSYRKITLLNNPLKATMFSRINLAKNRSIQNHWVNDTEIQAKELKIVEIEFSLKKEKELK
jgi:hypothetical protein